jgi:hypothetical protein
MEELQFLWTSRLRALPRCRYGYSPVDNTDLRQPYDMVNWTGSFCILLNMHFTSILYHFDDDISLFNSIKFWTLTIVRP